MDWLGRLLPVWIDSGWFVGWFHMIGLVVCMDGLRVNE